MINLLPPDIRETYMYAHRNTKLLHWCGGIFVGIIGIAVVIVLGQVYLTQSMRNIDRQVVQSRQELKDQRQAETQARVKEISDSLTLATNVLSEQVLFSRLLESVGGLMPSGSSLSDLSITEFSGGIDLTADSVDYQSATQVQVNLATAGDGLFQDVDIVSIDCSQETAAGEIVSSAYPCQGTYRALFAKDNPYKLLQRHNRTSRSAAE